MAMKVVFLHPDLGIGGAERSVIDAALALKSKGHSVEFVTAHHDSTHCFEETKNGSLCVTVAGDWLPRSIFGRFQALCAYFRMIYCALYLLFSSGITFDCIFCDQISACIPFLRLKKTRIIFYCHFPDLLLTTRKSILKKLYRAPLDWLEEKTTGMADIILVNSNFTAGIFHETFHSLKHISPTVLYPVPNFEALDKEVHPPGDDLMPKSIKTIFLSINRYERKKNLALAIKALSELKNQKETLADIHLIIAGGYDERVAENKEYYMELRHLATQLNLNDHITFLRSFSDSEKRTLLKHSTCLLYTPDREHFGIVPVEAMYLECPVIAVNSGGPLETVVDGVTGFHCQPLADDFAKAMIQFVESEDLGRDMGEAGRKRVEKKFSNTAYSNQLTDIVTGLLQ